MSWPRSLSLGGLFFILGNALAQETYVVVRPGDTLAGIAGRFFKGPVYSSWGNDKSGLDQLLDLNPELNKKSVLQIGQRIRVFGAGRDLARVEIQNIEEENKVTQLEDTTKVEAPLGAAPSEVQVTQEENNEGLVKELVDDSGYTRLELAPSLSFFEMNAKDTLSGADASVLSEASPGMKGRWIQSWSDDLRTFVGGAYTQVSLQPAEGLNNFTLDKGSLLSAELGVEKTFDQIDFEASFFYNEALFPRATAINEILIEAAPIMGIQLKMSKEFLKNANMSLSASPHLKYLMGASTSNYTVSSGYALGASLNFVQQLKNPLYQIQSVISYEYEKQSTSLVDQSRNILTFSLGASFKFE